jgi:endoglucanase
VLTGSDRNGRLAFSAEGAPATCSNWTDAGDGVAAIGHDDRFDASSFGNKRFPRWSGSWNAEHFTLGCGAKKLAESGGGGQIYCFATDGSPSSGAPPPAPAARFSYRRGLNINHWLGDNLPPSMLANSHYGADWFDEEDVAWIAAQGFDHLRIRVNGGLWLTQHGDLDEARLAPFDRALRWAHQHGLGVVLTMDGLPGFRSAGRGQKPRDAASPFTDEPTRGDAAYLWWQVGRRYAAEGDGLRFELLNAPGAKSAEEMRGFNSRCLAAVRRTSRTRLVYLTSRDMKLDDADEVDGSDPNTALAVQFWEPRVFAFQADDKRPAVRFPGPVPDLSSFARDDEAARRFSKAELSAALIDARLDAFAKAIATRWRSREVYVAAWGVYRRADDDSARSYVRAVRAALERNGFAWALYDYHTGCAVRDAGGQPTRVLEALRLASRGS